MKTIKSFQEIGSSNISKAQRVLDQTIFKSGFCQQQKKNYFLLNFHVGREIFPSRTKSRPCFEIPNIWQESQFICLTITIKSTRQGHVV